MDYDTGLPGWVIALIVIVVIIQVCGFIWVATANIRKRKKANERFTNDKIVQHSNISKLAGSSFAWIPKDIVRGQGRKVIDAASTRKGDDIDNCGGIYAFYVSSDDFNDSDFFLPIYVGKATRFRRRWMEHIKRINDAFYYENVGNKKSELKYTKIANYLHHKNLKPDDIRFVVMEVIPSDQYDLISKQEEAKYIKETGAGERGFNSDRA